MYKDYPLTKQQLGLWVEQKLHPSNTSYNTCVKVKLNGELNVDKFLNATREVIQFFETLKVSFVEVNGRPIQRIDQSIDYRPEYVDLSNKSSTEIKERELEAKKILSDYLNTPIELKKAPIMRGCLVKVSTDSYYYIGMVPHIVSDGRSAILYLESLSVAYHSAKEGLEQAYGDSKRTWQQFEVDGLFAVEYEKYLKSQQHWRERLKGANHYFDYSYGKALDDPDDRRGERVYFDLSEEMAFALKKHCKENRTTLFNVLVCAFSIFVHKYYQLDDILIGYPVNVRPPGYKHFFGFFVNIVPIRVEMIGDPSYQQLLRNVHQTRKEDKKHHGYPALDIVSDIRQELPDFDGRVFNLSMAQTVSRLFNLELEGIESTPLETEYYDVNDDFSLSYELIENRIGLWFEYRKCLFERSFIDQAMVHIEQIIKQMLSNPELRLSEFKLLDNIERNKLLKLYRNNDAELAYSSIVQLFEESSCRAKQNTAVKDELGELSYEQLNQQANQLARLIRERVRNQSKPVAVSLKRGRQLIVSLLAVLKAGCFYIPIPPSYPEQRKQYILKQSNASLLVTDSNKGLSEYSAKDNGQQSDVAKTLLIDQCFESISKFSDEDLNLPIDDNQVAYIIYTSGSTGLPKGVAVTHRNVCSRLLWLRSYFNLSSRDKMLQNTDFSFDVSVAEIFWPLISGATLVIAEQDEATNPNYLLKLIHKEKISVACMVPSLLRALLATDSSSMLESLSTVLSAGEALTDSQASSFYNHEATKNSTLYNLYGPTEGTIYASFEKVEKEARKSVTIGRPLAHTSLLVFDETMCPVPVGVVGQLYIGGEGVASGYHSNSKLTDRAFVANPFPQISGERLYATGDLARYLSDGRIDFIGRCDSQVKIRGYRIELEEIESKIFQCDKISDCCVINHKMNETQQQLVAFIVAENMTIEDRLFTKNLVKEMISKTLPNYMIPSLFVFIEEIPRLQSGKVNHKALPQPQEEFIQEQNVVQPDTEMERNIQAVWSQILNVRPERLSVVESFFDMGGDSLMAIQFVSLAKKEGMHFDMSDLFQSRTIRQLSLVAKEQPEVMNEKDDIVISGYYPLLPRQAKFFSDNFKNPNHWNRTFSFLVNNNLDMKTLKSAFIAVLKQHDNLRVSFQEDEQGGFRQYCESIEIIRDSLDELVVFFDLTGFKLSEQKKRIEEYSNELHQEIKLDNSPLIRVGYFKTGENSGQLVIIFHHLLIDMVSSRIVFEDLTHAYQSLLKDESIMYGQKSTSVKDWVDYLISKREIKRLENSLDFWSSLKVIDEFNLPTVPGINIENITSLNLEKNASQKAFVLPDSTTDKLLTYIPKVHGFAIQDLLLAAFHQSICGWAKIDATLISTCEHGRPLDDSEYDLSRTVGWINSVYPVFLKLPMKIVGALATKPFISDIILQLSSIPDNKSDYNLLKYSMRNPKLLDVQTPNLFFNYVGQIDAFLYDELPFKPAVDLPGIASIDGENHLCYQLYVEAGVVSGQLMFRVTYSETLFESSVILQLLEILTTTINQIVDDLDERR